MLWSSKHALLGALAFLLFLPDASATSDLAAGNFVEKVPSQIDYQDLGSCRFIPARAIPICRPAIS